MHALVVFWPQAAELASDFEAGELQHQPARKNIVSPNINAINVKVSID